MTDDLDPTSDAFEDSEPAVDTDSSELPEDSAPADVPEEPHAEESEAEEEEPEEEEPEEEASIEDRAARELTALEAVLRKTRRRMRSPLLAEGFAWMIATVGAVLVTGQFVGLALGVRGPAVMRMILLVGLGATAVGALVALVGYIRTSPSLEDVARRLQREVAEFRSDLVAALQFGRALRDGVDAEAEGWSSALAFAHLRRTTRAVLGRLDGGGTLGNLVQTRSLTPTLVAIGGCLVLLVAPMFVFGDKVQKLWTAAIFAPMTEASKGPEHRPIVGDIDLVFSYPPYTDMQRRIEPFTTGHIETLVGTEVTLKTYPLIRATKIEIVMKNADGERVVPMKSDTEFLEATLLLTKPGSYSFRAMLPDGTEIADGIERPIVLEPDQAPAVAITSHAGEVEVSPDEVLDIRYTVNDDYGIESVARATAFGKEEPKMLPLDLPELSSNPRAIEQELRLDLREFALQPKDVLTVWIEATDNNSLTGPGVGKAPPLVLRVTSPEDRHQKIIAEEMEILEALLDVLGDFLEQPLGERSPNKKGFYRQVVSKDITHKQSSEHHRVVEATHAKQTGVLTAMGAVVEKMKDDPLMTTRDITLFESLYEQLYALNRDGAEVINDLGPDARQETLSHADTQRLADWVAKDEDALEKGLVRLDNLLASQKMDSVRRTADEIRDMKERLKELLEKYRDTNDPALKEAIMREIQRMRQRMAELMQRMSSQLEKLPKEHINMEALEQAQLESDAKKMGDSLQQLEDLLEQGDIDGALQALEDMTASLDQMTEEMGKQFADAEPEGMREMDKALSELMDKANDLEARQRELESLTRDQQEASDRRERERIKQMLEERTNEIAELARQQRAEMEKIESRDLSQHDRKAAKQAAERAQKLEKLLEDQDIEQALGEARSAREELRAMQFSLELSERYSERKSDRGKDVRQSLGDLKQAQQRGRKIVNALEEIMDQARSQQSGGDDPQMQQLAQEQQGVSEQAEQLQKDVDAAAERFPMLEQKLNPPLGEARDQMGQAKKSLQGRKQQQALDHQRGALESLRQLKQSMRDALQKQKQQGKRDGKGRVSQDKVTIPTEDGRTHEDFREDVLDGMKQDRLQDYESEIERYYESLME